MGSSMPGYVKAGRVMRFLGWIGAFVMICVVIAIVAGMLGSAKKMPPSGWFAIPLVFVIGGASCWFQLFLGQAVKNHKEWARTVGIILSALQLFAFPLGTLIGAYILWQLWKGWDDPAPASPA